MMRSDSLRAVLILLALPLAAPAAGQTFALEFISPDRWGAPDVELGLGGGTVEDFEDNDLAPGLFIEIGDASGAFDGAGSPTLANVFDPVLDDPESDSFATGVWDGSHVLVNTASNTFITAEEPEWLPVAFYVPEGTAWFAFASQQVTLGTPLVVNGVSLGRLGRLGFNLSTGRNGVTVIRSTDPAAPIVSVSFGGGGDAFSVDHVVFAPPAAVTTEGASWGALKSIFR